jgi:hypothetical protein
MKRLHVVAIFATALIGGGTAAVSAASAAASPAKEVTVTGCVLKGDDGGFLLADLMIPAAPATVPQPRVLYWLEDDDDLEGHTGRRVEVTGELEGELEKGQIKIEREDNAVKLEIKADGRKLKLKLPETPAAIGTSGAARDDEKKKDKIDYVVRKLDVASVKMVQSTCR